MSAKHSDGRRRAGRIRGRSSLDSLWPAGPRASIVHAPGAEPEHYAEAVRAALVVRYAVLVETDIAHPAEWCDPPGTGKRYGILQILPPRRHPPSSP
jgi:hypothetical protein